MVRTIYKALCLWSGSRKQEEVTRNASTALEEEKRIIPLTEASRRSEGFSATKLLENCFHPVTLTPRSQAPNCRFILGGRCDSDVVCASYGPRSIVYSSIIFAFVTHESPPPPLPSEPDKIRKLITFASKQDRYPYPLRRRATHALNASYEIRVVPPVGRMWVVPFHSYISIHFHSTKLYMYF